MRRRAPLTEAFEIDGPSGPLEAVLDTPQPAKAGIAVVCHPHPLHGGTLTNKVAHTLARAFNQAGVAALRFNFRGVGRSAGEHADGVGERDDAIAAVRHARARHPDGPLYLGGFSFGAAVATQIADATDPVALVTVGLPVARLGADLALPRCPWLIVHGADDELISTAELTAWRERYAPGAQLDVIDAAPHFFHGRLTVLADTVVEFLDGIARAPTRPADADAAESSD